MKDLTQGSVTKHLLHMSAFLAASMLVQTLYLLADLYWVGHLGKEAIAAVGVAGNLMMIVLALTQMLGVGTTTLMSQAAGRKDQPHAEVVFNQSFVMSILIAFGLGVVGFILRPAYCDWLSADVATAELAKAYLLWFLPGLLLQFPLVALSSALRATFADFRNWSVAEAWCHRRRARDVHFDPNRRCVDDNLFRKKISLRAVPISPLSAANKNLETHAGDRCPRGRGVFTALRLHRARLRNHPRLWTGGPGRFRNRRARDAGALFTRSGA
jgi:MatE